MRARDVDILFLPGLGNSDEEHWQRRWIKNLPSARVVEQDAWDAPTLKAWQMRLYEAARAARRPIVLVAHSLGCYLALHSIHLLEVLLKETADGPPTPTDAPPVPTHIAGALLVAPPSRAALATLHGVDPAFGAQFQDPLSCPAVLIASVNDPYAAYADSAALAETTGAELINAGESGHINVASGHGPWPDGLLQLGRLLKRIG